MDTPSFLSQHSYESILGTVVGVAKEAGVMIMQALHTNTENNVHHKGRVDLVTDTGTYSVLIVD